MTLFTASTCPLVGVFNRTSDGTYVETFVKFLEFLINELSSIVCDDYAWQPKPANDIFPNEGLNFLGCDGS